MHPMLRDEIRDVVKASVQETLQHLGFTVHDPHAVQKDMIHLRGSRVRHEEFSKWIYRAVVTVLVSAGLNILWVGFLSQLMAGHR